MDDPTPARSDSTNTNPPEERTQEPIKLNGSARSGPSHTSPHFATRSCVTCRHRKVRCGRSDPCSNCVKAGIECIFPAPGRERRDSRKPQDAELVARLKQLEDVIKSLGGHVDDETGGQQDTGAVSGTHEGSDVHRRDSSMNDNKSSAGSPNSVDKHLGRLVINEGQSQYVSDSFWANTGDEGTEIQDIVNTPSLQGDGESSSQYLSQKKDASISHQGFIFGYALTIHNLKTLHPTQTHSFVLMLIFEENCDPVVKITHRPTVRKIFIKAANGIENLSRAEEALLFSIYYGGVCSLTQKQCRDQLGEEQGKLTSRFRLAVEQALARANFLTTPSLMAMQAFVLFLIFLRSQDDMRIVWSLSGLATHLARSLGVHRDGTIFGLSPFETEMRRRLWWHISLLDSRSTEDQGAEPSFTEAFYDAKLPLNINDDDISPETKNTPKERTGTTEMTFCLIRFELSGVLRQMNFTLPGTRPCETKLPAKNLAETEKWIAEIRKRIEDKYLQHCDTMVPIYWATATVGRLILAKLWLMAYHPLQYSRSDSRGIFTKDVRDRLFLTSVELIEYGSLLDSHEGVAKWEWLFRTYMQWHAMAFVLSELCHNPLRLDHERAWSSVESYYDKRAVDCPRNQKGMLWRPLQQLMARAQASREACKRGISSKVERRVHSTSSSQLNAQLESNPFGKFVDPAFLPLPLPVQISTQTQQPPKQTPVQRSSIDMSIASWQGHEDLSRQDAEAFGWSGWTQETLGGEDVAMTTQELDLMPLAGGFDDWL